MRADRQLPRLVALLGLFLPCCSRQAARATSVLPSALRAGAGSPVALGAAARQEGMLPRRYVARGGPRPVLQALRGGGAGEADESEGQALRGGGAGEADESEGQDGTAERKARDRERPAGGGGARGGEAGAAGAGPGARGSSGGGHAPGRPRTSSAGSRGSAAGARGSGVGETASRPRPRAAPTASPPGSRRHAEPPRMGLSAGPHGLRNRTCGAAAASRRAAQPLAGAASRNESGSSSRTLAAAASRKGKGRPRMSRAHSEVCVFCRSREREKIERAASPRVSEAWSKSESQRARARERASGRASE